MNTTEENPDGIALRTLTQRTLSLEHDGLTLTADLLGDPTRDLVMLVHGFPDTPHSWHAVADILVEAGYCVLLPWLRGYTLASCRRDAHYNHFSAGGDLEAWRQKLGHDRVHLVGHDWGAIAAQSIAACAPDGWASLSSLAIPPFQHPEKAWRLLPGQLIRSSYMLRLQTPGAGNYVRRDNCAYLHRLWTTWSPGWQFSDSQFQAVRDALGHPETAHASTRYYRALFTWNQPRTREALASVRQDIRVPTLALSGIEDGCMHSGLMDAAIDPLSFPAGVRAVCLPDCGHFLQAEQPERVAAELLRHFSQYPV